MTFFLVIGVFYSFIYCRQEKMCDIIIYRKSDLAPVQIALWVEHLTIDISEARVQIWSGPSAIFSNPVHVNGESDCACIQLNWWGRGRGVVRMFHCLLAFLIVWFFFQFRPRVHFPHKNLERNRNQRGKVLYET